jgi:hypothetical protein
MQVLFYIGKGKLFDRLIRWWTNSRYSHCEIVINGMAFSADAWTNQVRAVSASSFNPQNWEWVTVDGDKEASLTFVTGQLGKRYDWLGILGFLLPGRINDPKRWYCSEICAAALGIGKRPISPQQLYEILQDKIKQRGASC